MNRLFFLLLVFLFFSFKLKRDKKHVEIKYEQDGQIIELNNNYEFFVMSIDGKSIPLKWEGNRFEVSDFNNQELVDVFFVYKGNKLKFANVSVNKFEGTWIIGIDKKPFNKEVLDLQSVSKKVKYYYYIKFKSTNLVVAVYKRGCHRKR